jgi:hypothetical protein
MRIDGRMAAEESDAGGALLRVKFHAKVRERLRIPNRRRRRPATCGSRAERGDACNGQEVPYSGTPRQPSNTAALATAPILPVRDL